MVLNLHCQHKQLQTSPAAARGLSRIEYRLEEICVCICMHTGSTIRTMVKPPIRQQRQSCKAPSIVNGDYRRKRRI